MSPRVVAFDLGGVVVDVDHGVLAGLGPRVREEEALFGDARHDALTVGALDGEAFVAAAAAALDEDVDVVARRWREVVRFADGGLALLEATARVCPVAVWSNTDPLHWGELGPALEAIAVDVAPSFRLGAMKPADHYFRRALARLGVDPGEVLVLDDRADNVAAARAIGIDAVVVVGVAAAREVLLQRGVLPP
jgi:FMN phosphatase YigB (HAD superfamily)